MTIDDFLSRLEGVEKSGGGWVARCPAHEDDNPSLSVNVGSDGRILLHCHAGCTFEQVVAAMGLKPGDLMPDDGTAKASAPARRRADAGREVQPSFKARKPRDYGELVANYDYQNERGEIIFRVQRRLLKSGKKTFVQEHPDPESKYGWSFGVTGAGIKRVPFRLPKVLAAAKAGKSVIIVEGEKDVLTVERTLGCVATCNPGGAGKWEAGWGEFFKGCRSVCIIADADPMYKADKRTGEDKLFAVGQRHACKVEAMLRADGYEGGIRKIYMPDVEGRHVKDFTDWVEAIEAGGKKADRAAFQAMIADFTGWPEEWEFGGEQLDGIECAQKSARNTLSSSTAEGEEKSVGRFGRWDPRAPDNAKVYEVDFDIGGGRLVELRLQQGWPIEMIFAYSVATVSRKCPNNEVPRGVPARLKAWSAAIWLVMRGSFFWHADHPDFENTMYLDRDPKSCKLMMVMSDEFFAFVGHHARLEDVEPKKGDLAKILGLVKQIALDPDYSRGVVPANSWDRRGKVVYISSGDTQMCRIEDGKARFVQNGTDGVVFLRGKTLAPWKLVEGAGIDPFEKALIFSGASFADDYGLMNVRLWVLNLFASHQTKPPMLITGGAGSGKTRMAKAIKEILGIRCDGALDLSVQQIEDGDKGLDAFWAAVNDGKLEVFDNFDTKIKWASDTLQNAATDGQTKRRTLYTTFGVSILKANASLILTSNNPIFTTEGNGGLADRTIGINLVRNRSVSRDRELSEDIRNHRDEFLTWMVRVVAKVMMDDRPVEDVINERHPDYGSFCVRIGRAIDKEKDVVRALGAAEADKSLLPLKNDAITKEILEVLKRGNWNWHGSAKDMSDAILARMGDDADDKTRAIYSSRRVAKALSKYMRQFSIVFKMKEPHIMDGITQYDFMGWTVRGEAVSGLVDLKPDFGKTLGGADARRDMPKVGFKSTDPLTRAGAGVGDSSLEEREREESIEDDGESGGSEWGLDL